MYRRGSSIGFIAVVIMLIIGLGVALAASPKRGGTLRVAYGNKVSHLTSIRHLATK